MKVWMGFFDNKGEEFCRRVETHVENRMFVASPDIPPSGKIFVDKVGLSAAPDGEVLIEAAVGRPVTGSDYITVGGNPDDPSWVTVFTEADNWFVPDSKPVDDEQIVAAVEVLKEWNERL